MIPNGIDPQDYLHLPDPAEAEEARPGLHDRLVVLFLGRLSPEKGLDQLVGAWSIVVAKCPQAILVLAGPDHRNYRGLVQNLVDTKGLGSSVIMPGMLRGREKLAMLSRADVLVQPSYSEVLGLAVLEALACAKPCVITTGCNFEQVAAIGAGRVVEPAADALAAALIEVLSLSLQDRQMMGMRGRALVLQNYTWDIVARKMLTVYSCIVSGQEIPLYPEPANV